MIELSNLPPFEDGRIDPRHWFEHHEQDFEIEIGSGKGTFLVQQAPLRPETNFLGIERALAYGRYADDRMRRRGIANVRIMHGDAIDFIHYWCADAVAKVVHVYFSDPWPKKRHHKRRVIQDRSLQDLHRVLLHDGQLRLVTDHESLWSWYELHADRHADLFERRPFAAPESAGPGELVGTNYERKFAREGRPFFAMTLVKRSS
ncbi:MAG: tRNA (guanosine(46)-N7)-methyltransferase TrmB [Planctomycetota bacterium]